ncbi:MAG: hypothetical protein DIZ77_04700 [endosymbiont of Seepiophila jonesi]|uniref:AAA domain-containing protein n=1 Tax=endosymbiont of Lamellibrachia luymesi TaxID=2200907 RepID=A0A370DH79_9GAMM|nr:MAG: hypothetical protein DIZ79_17230 [endosymbiont of Lamellibrachia luymesi]RDH93775.1 MAG: hypothetical protein DIZ77_04700 [endosymbiont of Seepiophila jonesi]
MRRIAVINQKGGVGKTTITTNLGHALALLGHRVTVIDLDPQGQLAASFGIFRPPSKGIDQVLLEGLDIESVRVSARDLVTLIPAGNRLHKVEELHEGGATRARLLQTALQEKLQDQAFVLYDCPPSSGMLVANAVFAADEVLIPVSGEWHLLKLLGMSIFPNFLPRCMPGFDE